MTTGPTRSSAWPRAVQGVAFGLVLDAVVTGVIFAVTRAVTVWAALGGLYVLPVLPVGAIWGLWPALITGLVGALAFFAFFWADLVALQPVAPRITSILVIVVATAVVVSWVGERARRHASEADALARDLQRIAEEQSALRRVATLVARGVAPGEAFAAVAAEVGRVLGCDYTVLSRFDADDAATVVGAWATAGVVVPVPAGRRLPLGDRNVHTLVGRTGRPARLDSYGPDAGAAPAAALAAGMDSAVGTPIEVEGRLWGVMIAASRGAALPADTEGRLAGFTELVATAVANAEARAQLRASRARIVATADATRRRIERDLHDGVQQHLVSLALELRVVQEALGPGAGATAAGLDGVAQGLGGVLDELREVTRGIHPAALAQGGLHPALKALARRSPVPVRLDVRVEGRLPGLVELAAYYTVAEALTNTAAHAEATVVDVVVAAGEGVLRLEVRDDGRGGATVGSGSGLVGLGDRVEALGGRFTLHSPPGGGTTIRVELPLPVATGPAPATAGTGLPSGHEPDRSTDFDQPSPAL